MAGSLSVMCCEKGKAKYDTNAQKTRVATLCIAPREEGNGNGLATNAIQSVAACLARARERLPPRSQTPVLYPPQCHIEKPNDRGPARPALILSLFSNAGLGITAQAN